MDNCPARRITPFSDRIHLGGHLLRREPQTAAVDSASINIRADLWDSGLFRHADHRPSAFGDPKAPLLIRGAIDRYYRTYSLRRTAHCDMRSTVRQIELNRFNYSASILQVIFFGTF